MDKRPEGDPRTPRTLAGTLAIYAILLVVALVALGPLNARDVPPELMTLAGQPPAVVEQAADADRDDR